MATLKFVIDLDSSPGHDSFLHFAIDGKPFQLVPAVVAALVSNAKLEVLYDREGRLLLASCDLEEGTPEAIRQFAGDRQSPPSPPDTRGSRTSLDDVRKVLRARASGRP